MRTANAPQKVKAPKNRLPDRRKNNIIKRFWKTRFLFMLFLPALIFYILFKYVPMWGIQLAWRKYSVIKGLAGSKWIAWYNFEVFFKNPRWFLYTRNTFALGLQSLLVTFPLVILFALLMNEVRGMKFKRVTQTITYLPHFLSTVVVVSLMRSLCDPTYGAVNLIIKMFGGEAINFFFVGKWFRPLYLISEIWSGLGWGTIVYLAAIASVDPGLYEAARLDGAGRWRQMWNITLPSIAPTVSTMFIMKVGHIMGDSMEKVILMQEATTLNYSDTLSSYVYTLGFSGQQGQSTAINLFSSIVNLCFLVGANWVSKKLTENSIF